MGIIDSTCSSVLRWFDLEQFIAAGGLLICTIAASVIYYRIIRKAQQQIDGSIGTMNTMMASFSRQLARVTRRVDALQVSATQPVDNDRMQELRELLRSSMDGLSGRASGLESELLSLKTKVEHMATPSEAAVLPVFSRREPESPSYQAQSAKGAAPAHGSPLGGLNQTELSVLNLLDLEGELTGPRIREALGRTREHTARLLKKLYDAGFIDRSIGQMPYRYRIRKELTELLRSEQKKMDLAP